jgi:hypothetical protein
MPSILTVFITVQPMGPIASIVKYKGSTFRDGIASGFIYLLSLRLRQTSAVLYTCGNTIEPLILLRPVI